MATKTWKKWTDEEIKLLKYHWVYSTMEELEETFPERSYASLMNKANSLGIKSLAERKRKGDFAFLNNLNSKSAYWWGFIMADGHLSKTGKLDITLSSKDKDHLLKLAGYLNTDNVYDRVMTQGYSNNSSMTTLALQDKKVINKWRSLLKIEESKTYNPPDLSVFINKELLIYFFIGFVDGDGCVWLQKGRWPSLKLEVHKSWVNLLQLIASKLNKFYNIKCKLKSIDSAVLTINTKPNFDILKNYLKEVDYLERKWKSLL